MFWFEPKNKNALFCDIRSESHILCDGRVLNIAPNVQCDFTQLPFPDESFYLVVFDPPHLTKLGNNSWLAKKYGKLIGDWRDDIAEGFKECFRVLKPNGTLVFKWNTTDVDVNEVLSLSRVEPLFGHTSGRLSKTIWATFLKP